MAGNRRQRFVHAYLGEAAGNATKAAILAGYSEKAARQVASRLLTYADVQQAIATASDAAGLTVEQSLREVSSIATAQVEKVTAADKLKANELFLKAKGALRDKQGDSRISVSIGFLSHPGSQPQALVSITDGQTIDAQMVAKE